MSVPSNLVPTRILQLPEDPSPSDTGWMMYVNNGVTYKVQVNAVLNVSGVPTTRAIIAGTGLAGGGTLASNVTLSVAPGGIGATELDATGVGAGVYGDSANYPVITVDANGRITAATELAFPSPSGFVPTSREVIAGIGLSGGGALTTNVTLNADLSDATPEPVGAEGPGTSQEMSRADHVHPAIDLSDTQQTANELDISRGGTGTALTSPANGGMVYSDGNSLQVSTAGSNGQVLVSTGAGAPTWGSAVLLTDQPANYIYAGPASGPDAPTAFRTLVNADLPNSGVSANTYGTAATIPVFAVNSKGVLTGVTNTVVSLTNANLQYSSITIGSSLVTLGSTITTLVGTSISGATNSLSNIPNSALTNNSITIGSTAVALGGTITTLAGTSISGATNTLTAIPNASLDNSSITVNGKSVSLGGSTSSDALTIGTGLTGTSYTGAAPVTIAIDSTVATLTGVQTLTNKTLTTPLVNDILEINSSAVTGYTPFADSLLSMAADENNFQIAYGVNLNNGSDASFDFVAYNDASDVNSYFIDMGMNSSNFSSVSYPIFTANSGYLFTGGGTSGQEADLFIGTSNAASDLVFFTGDVLTSSVRATIKGNTGNFLLGTATDTGYGLNNVGTTYLGGAATFGSTVLLNADPTLALQAATKQYVDNQVTAGLHLHDPVLVETTGNLNATYAQGGTTFDITDITGTDTVTTSVNHGLSIGDQIWLYTSAGNGLSTNTAYFVYSTPALNQLTLSLTFGGAQITGLTNASGLTYNTRANSGVGATLTNAGTQAAIEIDGVSLSTSDRVMVRLQTNGFENGVYTVTTVGDGSTNWVLTRATDSNRVDPADPNGVGTGDYYYTQDGDLNAGDSHVLTTEPNTMIIGYTTLTYTQFSGAVTYTGGTNIDVTGQTISLTGTVAATNGGTGTNTVTTGDLLYGSAANTWSKLAKGIGYKSLVMDATGTNVEWNAVALNQAAAVSGQLGVSNGGTGQSSFVDGELLIGNSTGNTLAKATLTAGTGINITNGSGTITVAANIDGGTF
jgi:hypothetical protein